MSGTLEDFTDRQSYIDFEGSCIDRRRLFADTGPQGEIEPDRPPSPVSIRVLHLTSGETLKPTVADCHDRGENLEVNWKGRMRTIPQADIVRDYARPSTMRNLATYAILILTFAFGWEILKAIFKVS